jgi:hypothetical protein
MFDAVVETHKGLAAQRPSDLAANFSAALNILHLRGSVEEAQPYIDRIDELLTPQRAGAVGFYRVAQWRRMLPAYAAWKEGNLEATRLAVEREEALLPRWPVERGRMAAQIGEWYITLGRWRDAERLLASSGQIRDLIPLAELREDVQTLRGYLSRLPPDVHVDRLVRAGLLEEARARLGTPVFLVEQEIENIGRATLWVATGERAAAIPLLRKVLATGTHFDAPYHKSCEVLAKALVQENRRADAVAELERCTAVSPHFSGGLNAGYWMKNLLTLAEEYRESGRAADAERVEARLRRLLMYADDDHPIVIRLGHAKGK